MANRLLEKIDSSPGSQIDAANWALERFTTLGVDVPNQNRLLRARNLIAEVQTRGAVPVEEADLRSLAEAQHTILDLPPSMCPHPELG